MCSSIPLQNCRSISTDQKKFNKSISQNNPVGPVLVLLELERDLFHLFELPLVGIYGLCVQIASASESLIYKASPVDMGFAT
jgi:hypothetical protein